MHMNRVIVQVPMSKALHDKAERKAKKNGFSSLQELIRVFLVKFVDDELQIRFELKKK